MLPYNNILPDGENNGDKAITYCILNTQMIHYILYHFLYSIFHVSNNILNTDCLQYSPFQVLV